MYLIICRNRINSCYFYNFIVFLTLLLGEAFFIGSVFFYNTSVKNVFIRISKNDSNSIFDNISYKYKNVFNNNKLLKKTFITKIKYYYKQKTFITKKYINIYIIKKQKKIFL